MSDLEHEEAESDSAPDGEENTSAVIDTSITEEEKPNPIAVLLLKVWSAIMIISTAILSFYVFILKDDSVVPFVILGIIGLCLPPVVNILRERARSKRRQEELEERLRIARQERIEQARQNEIDRLARAKQYDELEEAEHEAIKNTDVAAYKINNEID